MKIVKPSWKYIKEPNGEEILKTIELAGKLCYQSIEDKKSSPEEFVRKAIRLGHLSVIEHISIGVVIITDRGVTHELVRHRLASYSQESTRYCNYSKDKFGNELTFVSPYSFSFAVSDLEYLKVVEAYYISSIRNGLRPEQARAFLPNCLKAEIAITCNLREWRHIFKLRTSAKAHPDIRGIMNDILEDFRNKIPVVFEIL